MKLWFFLSVMFLISPFTNRYIYAEEIQAENTIESIPNPEEFFSSEYSESFTSESDIVESFPEEKQTVEVPVTSIQISAYYPYVQFVNYQYRDYNSDYKVQNLIMEYQPDENGRFQSVAFNGQDAVAYVFQIKPEGLYLISKVDGYQEVGDIRYSGYGVQGESLILPFSLTIGDVYYRGFDSSYKCKIDQLISVFTLNGATYNDVVKIIETSPNYPSGHSYNYYYAPSYGLIYIEESLSDGSTQPIFELSNVQGQIS